MKTIPETCVVGWIISTVKLVLRGRLWDT